MHLHRALSTCSCCTSSQETVREASSLLFHFHSDTNTTTTPHYQLPTATFGRTELKCLLTFPDLDPKPAQHFFAYSRKMGSKPQTPSPFALLPFRGGAPHPHPTPPHPTPPHPTPHPTPPHPTPPHPTPHPTPITVAYVPRFGWAWGGGGEGRGGERRGGVRASQGRDARQERFQFVVGAPGPGLYFESSYSNRRAAEPQNAGAPK